MGYQGSHACKWAACPSTVLAHDAQDWYGDMNLMTFLRDTGRFARVGTMLAKDSVKTRLESPQGISFTEFCYQLLCALSGAWLHLRVLPCLCVLHLVSSAPGDVLPDHLIRQASCLARATATAC